MPMCGNCRENHSSVADVRACYAGRGSVATMERPAAPVSSGRVTLGAPVPATERQLGFLRTLADERELPVAGMTGAEAFLIERVEDVLGGKDITKNEASDAITYLLGLPRASQPQPTGSQPETAEVPAGRYAVENADGVLRFYKIDHGKGRWAGRTFVNVMASDEEHPVRGEAARTILAKIAENPAAASARYGHEIGACGICGRTLTDETSRARGIGPICADKAGW